MNRPTYVFSQTLTHTLYMWEYTLNRHIYALTLTHLHSLMPILQFPQMDRQTWSNSGTSPYMQFPPVPAPFPLKTLPLYSLWTKKNTLSFCTYTHTQKTGDFQPLRNSSVIAGALLSIKTWPFQHVCAVLGAVGTNEEEDRGLPCSVVVWPNLPLPFSTSTPPKHRDLPLRPHVLWVWRLGGEDTANAQIRLLAGGHQRRNRTMWKGQGETELPCLTAVPRGWRKIRSLRVEPRHYSGTNVRFLLVPMGK